MDREFGDGEHHFGCSDSDQESSFTSVFEVFFAPFQSYDRGRQLEPSEYSPLNHQIQILPGHLSMPTSETESSPSHSDGPIFVLILPMHNDVQGVTVLQIKSCSATTFLLLFVRVDAHLG